MENKYSAKIYDFIKKKYITLKEGLLSLLKSEGELTEEEAKQIRDISNFLNEDNITKGNF